LSQKQSWFRDDYKMQTIQAVVTEAFSLELHFGATFYLTMKRLKQSNEMTAVVKTEKAWGRGWG